MSEDMHDIEEQLQKCSKMTNWDYITSLTKYQAQQNHKNCDEAVQEAIRKKLKDLFPEIEKILQYVDSHASSIGKSVDIRFVKSEDNFIAQTDSGYPDKIVIEINQNIENQKLKSVIIHELGEADYALKQFPGIVDSKDLLCKTKSIIELFSHRYTHNLAEKFGFHDINDIKKDSIVSFKDFVRWYEDPYKEPWYIALKLAWLLITFPTAKSKIQDFPEYNEYRDCIDQIVAIVTQVEFESAAIEEIEEAMAKVIAILKDRGMHEVYVKSRRSVQPR